MFLFLKTQLKARSNPNITKYGIREITSTYSIHHTNTDNTCSSCVQHDAHDHARLNG